MDWEVGDLKQTLEMYDFHLGRNKIEHVKYNFNKTHSSFTLEMKFEIISY